MKSGRRGKLNLDVNLDRGAGTTLRGFEGQILMNVDRSDLNLVELTGTLRINLVRGQLQASDFSGSLTLTVDRGERAVLTRLRGSVLIEADRTNVVLRDVRIEGDSDVVIDRGDFDVELAENLPLTIDADLSSRADFNSDLPVTLQQTGDRFQGTVNGGGPANCASARTAARSGSDPTDAAVPNVLLERDLQADARRPGNGRVRVDALHPVDRLARQPGGVEVVDVRDVRIEQVEPLDRDAQLLVQGDAELGIPDGGRCGLHAVVLDQRPGAEVSHADAAENPSGGLDRHGARDDPVERAGNVRTGRGRRP